MALNADGWYEPQNLYFRGTTIGVGGTSISSPEFAGFFAQENAYLLYLKSLIGDTCGPNLNAACAPMGAANPYLYNEARNRPAPHYPFYDITQGCNYNDITRENNLTYYCAASGYDQVTGWGSANMFQLAWAINYALAADGLGPSVAITGPPVNHWYNSNLTINWTMTDRSGNGRQPNGVAGSTRGMGCRPGRSGQRAHPRGGQQFLWDDELRIQWFGARLFEPFARLPYRLCAWMGQRWQLQPLQLRTALLRQHSARYANQPQRQPATGATLHRSSASNSGGN